MKFLIYDTETGGIPDWKSPSKSPTQPHLISIGAILIDEHDTELERYYTLIKPDGWEVDPESFKIHGISQERALAEGIDEDEALHQLMMLMGQADVRVGYNEMFDRRIARIALYRFARGLDPGYGHGIGDIEVPPDIGVDGLRELVADWWNYGPPDYDVMAGCKALMGVTKNPKLSAAYFYAFGDEMPEAHNAVKDAQHTRELFVRLMRDQIVTFDPAWFADKAAYKARKAAEKLAARPGYD